MNSTSRSYEQMKWTEQDLKKFLVLFFFILIKGKIWLHNFCSPIIIRQHQTKAIISNDILNFELLQSHSEIFSSELSSKLSCSISKFDSLTAPESIEQKSLLITGDILIGWFWYIWINEQRANKEDTRNIKAIRN